MAEISTNLELVVDGDYHSFRVAEEAIGPLHEALGEYLAARRPGADRKERCTCQEPLPAGGDLHDFGCPLYESPLGPRRHAPKFGGMPSENWSTITPGTLPPRPFADLPLGGLGSAIGSVIGNVSDSRNLSEIAKDCREQAREQAARERAEGMTPEDVEAIAAGADGEEPAPPADEKSTPPPISGWGALLRHEHAAGDALEEICQRLRNIGADSCPSLHEIGAAMVHMLATSNQFPGLRDALAYAMNTEPAEIAEDEVPW